ncbi:glycerophosphodiester phosphodiesterase, partial [bacterium]|nr:glycerophosphodiester phosphodiesterase [bacterium]
MKMLCTTITVLILCSAMSMYGSDNILIIAHRGASGDLPENT